MLNICLSSAVSYACTSDIDLELSRQLGPLPENVSVLEKHKGDQTQDRSNNGQDQSGILAANIGEELSCEQWCHGAQSVSQ